VFVGGDTKLLQPLLHTLLISTLPWIYEARMLVFQALVMLCFCIQMYQSFDYFNSLSNVDQTAANSSVNIGFLVGATSGVSGSQFLRGIMMSDFASAVPHCNRSSVYTASAAIVNQLVGDRPLHACIVVKFPHPLPSVCRKIGAAVLYDSVDHDYILRRFEKILASPAEKKGFSMKMEYNIEDLDKAIWLVQSERLANELVSRGIKSYNLPHQHTNIGNWGQYPSRPLSSPSDTLVVGFLVGNMGNAPNVGEYLMPAICAAGAELWLITQNQETTGRSKGTYCVVKSTRTRFICNPAPNNVSSSSSPSSSSGLYHTEIKNFITETNEVGDEFGQAAYYLDKALYGVDIGLITPHTYGKQNITKLFTYPNMRPPTRLLHWLSRGVPTLYYPTLAYEEVATKAGYGESLGLTLRISDDVNSIIQGINSLRPLHIRQALRNESLSIAKKYSSSVIAVELIRLVQYINASHE